MSGAEWIWYPFDFEIWLNRQVSLRRTERGVIYPPVWKMEDFYTTVTFHKKFELKNNEVISVLAEGECNVILDRLLAPLKEDKLAISAGAHEIFITVVNRLSPPAIYVRGINLFSDNTWYASRYRGVFEAGEDNPARWQVVGSAGYTRPEAPPSRFNLATTRIEPDKLYFESSSEILVDFGRETFGYLSLEHLEGAGKVQLFYGESEAEARSTEHCEVFDEVNLADSGSPTYRLALSRAFRYVYIKTSPGLKIGKVAAYYEFLPVEYRGAFRCDNQRLNEIWDISLYTLHLTTREFFIDGIKRDRWVWSGDAYQSALMNYYSFFDLPVTRRTITALRGKEPPETHLNLIMDYTFYWFIGLEDYLLYTGDFAFIKAQFPNMVSLLEFCLGRTNQDGLLAQKPGDWVFIDWADLDNRGEVSTEQILFCRSLEVMAGFAGQLAETGLAARYAGLARQLKQRIFEIFWDSTNHYLRHNRYQGKLSSGFIPHPNLFALMLGYLDDEQTKFVLAYLLDDKKTKKITTPYMRFYELAALGQYGQQAPVVSPILDYWGGMLDNGATTFWETFNPDERGAEHYAMYGRPFGKSLCHSWGASPIYLIGKYLLGVRPLKNGYSEYCIEPDRGGLDWIEGSVPTPDGDIGVFMDATTIKIQTANRGRGYLRFHSLVSPKVSQGNLKEKGNQTYELVLEQPNQEYLIQYTSTF